VAEVKETAVDEQAVSGAAERAGVKTSEFWTAVLLCVANAVPAVATALSGQAWAAWLFGVLATAVPVVYVWGRAVLKMELARQTDVIPDRWEPLLGRVFDVLGVLAERLPKAPDGGGEGAGDGGA